MQKFTRIYTFADLNMSTSATDIALVNGKWTRIAYIKVSAQSFAHFGAGAIANGVDSRFYCKMRVDSASGEIKGVARFVYEDANQLNTKVVMEERTERLDTGTSVQLGEVPMKAKEDSYLAIYFNPDSDTTLDCSDTDNVLLLPVTLEM